MPSPAESEPREVLYCGQTFSIPGRLLYKTEQLGFVQFRTKHWPGYTGYQSFVTVAVFIEHLKILEEQPPDAEAPPHEVHPRVPNAGKPASVSVETPEEPESTKSADISESEPEKLVGKNVPSKIKFPAHELSSRSPGRTRQIANLTLRDYGF